MSAKKKSIFRKKQYPRPGRVLLSHLYKKFVNERVIGLIDNLDNIRNCTVIAHIDHGKTTLTDSLIASSGLLSPEIAARAKLMDYDLIEQERGITIKASGISLIHSIEDREFLIHLVDTPGHIDFSSHVTRGLRITDGAIIVIDAIEGLMVQTETVTRQAMKELVRPVLFVNKVDRLIKEKRLGTAKTASEVNKSVREFNAMLGKYLDDDRLEEWEVSFIDGTLCIGSALDKWAIGIETLEKKAKGVTSTKALTQAFKDIMQEIVNSYNDGEEIELQKKYPIAQVVLNSVVRKLPSPRIAQQYRVPQFWDGDLKSKSGQALTACDRDGPCVLLVGDVQPDRHAGNVAAVRVLSGCLKRASPMRNLRDNSIDKTLQIGIFMSRSRIALNEVPCGNLAFISGFKAVMIGDTLVDASEQDIVPIGALRYPTEPVVTYAVEPKRLSELGEVQEPIAAYAETDPALEFEMNEETGEMLLSGAGELHIEISIEKLARSGTDLVLGQPMVLIKEQMSKRGEIVETGSEKTSEFRIEAVNTSDIEDISTLGTKLDSDMRSENYLIDLTGKIDEYGDAADWIREAFREVTRRGPLQAERVRQLTVLIHEAEIRLEAPETSWRDVTQPLIKGIRESIMSGSPRILEPWLKLEISTPEDHVGTLSSILARRKGHILEIDSERTLYRISAEIPVGQSFGLANEIRTATSGWATWGAKAGGYREIVR